MVKIREHGAEKQKETPPRPYEPNLKGAAPGGIFRPAPD
jgi:hypothetical protein